MVPMYEKYVPTHKLGSDIFANMTIYEDIVGKDQVKEDEMDRACSTNGGKEECM
jgi:hypothetical protein